MLLSRDALVSVVGKVEADDFYRPAHKALFSAMMSLYDDQGGNVDPVTVSDKLEGTDVIDELGGPAYLVSLQVDAPAIGHAVGYAKVVREHAVRRRMVALGQELSESGFTPSEAAIESLKDFGAEIHDLSLRAQARPERSAVEYTTEAMQDYVERWVGNGGGTSTGFSELDKIIDGLHPGRSYILGARPAMGKTALALNIATKVAMDGDAPVLFFTIEMDGMELAKRALLAQALIGKDDMEEGRLTNGDWLRLKEVRSKLNNGMLKIDPASDLTMRAVTAKARQVKAQYGKIGLIVIDYIGIMSDDGKSESRQLEISARSRGIKLLAKDVETPILTLAQLSRSLESRLDKRPTLADLRESGSLEQDADVVMFLYRDEEYNGPDSKFAGFAEVIVAKNRHGKKGRTHLAFLDSMARFIDPAKVA